MDSCRVPLAGWKRREFYAEGMKASLQAPGWLAGKGLDAYEYQCGRGVRVTEASAAALGRKAAEHGIRLSIHAPYFISLASQDEQKRLNSLIYIRDSARGGGMDGGGTAL